MSKQKHNYNILRYDIWYLSIKKNTHILITKFHKIMAMEKTVFFFNYFRLSFYSYTLYIIFLIVYY